MRLPFSIVDCFSPSNAVIDGGMEDGTLVHGGFRVFSYAELKSATNGFHPSNKIGQGGFGSVYRGRLRDGTAVAVKVLSVELESMVREREFVTEISALSDVKHGNLVTLRGCCIEGADRFLVYDHIENNSLAQILSGEDQKRMRFDWDARRDISLGIAHGLAYLHEEVKPYIVHRDIKASNILLDRNFMPKVSDFGLSKLLTDDFTHISTRVAGTLGYLSPEYAISGRLTRKSDVYSFGVLVLEIISGLPIVMFDSERGEEIHIVQKAWEAYMEGDLFQIIDPVLDVNNHQEEVSRFIKVGLLCVQEAAKTRPRMSTAIKMLTGEVEVGNVLVTQPGHIIDLMDIRIGDKRSSPSKDSPSRGSVGTQNTTALSGNLSWS